MSIQASNANARLNLVSNAKALDPAPGDDMSFAPVPPEPPRRDSLKLSTEVSAAMAVKVQTTTPEAKPPETPGEAAQNEAGLAKTPTAPARKDLRNFPPYHPVITPLTEQRAAIETALGGRPTTFKNVAGGLVTLVIAKGANTPEGHERYQVKVGAASLDVTVGAGLDTKELLTRLVDVYSKVPEHLRGCLKKVVLSAETNPKDEYWAKEFNFNGFASGASAGDGLITFWKLQTHTHNLSQGTFNHEFGHLIGETLSTSRKQFAMHAPDGWADAAIADIDVVTDYASHNVDEDFAETWSYFVYAKTDPQAMEAMRERFPNRIKILEAIYNNEFERKPEKSASRRSRTRQS